MVIKAGLIVLHGQLLEALIGPFNLIAHLMLIIFVAPLLGNIVTGT